MAGHRAVVLTSFKDETGVFLVSDSFIDASESMSISKEILPGVVDVEFPFPLKIPRLLALVMGCSRVSGQTSDDVRLRIKTNDPQEPDDVFDIKPSRGIAWTHEDQQLCPLTCNVDPMLYVSSLGTGLAELHLRVLSDPHALVIPGWGTNNVKLLLQAVLDEASLSPEGCWVLSDALEEAGYDNGLVLRRLRMGGYVGYRTARYLGSFFDMKGS